MSTHTAHFILRANHLTICDLPAEVLILVLASLHGQDIARCIRVCRRFSDLIHSDIRLQYGIELALNGMIDGNSSVLPTSERLRRLRQYSSQFRRGLFHQEDHTAHPGFTLRIRSLGLSGSLRRLRYDSDDRVSSSGYSKSDGESDSLISVFDHGSAQAGIQSHRWLVPIGITGLRRYMRTWAVDSAQDLLVRLEMPVTLSTSPLQMQSRIAEIYLYSLSASQTLLTTHPAAMLPCFPVLSSRYIKWDSEEEITIFNMRIFGDHVLYTINVTGVEIREYSVELCNWRTGQLISRTDIGIQPIRVVPLYDSYVLVTPSNSMRRLDIYSLSPSVPSPFICTLELPNSDDRKRISWYRISTGERTARSEGHFRADPSPSVTVVALTGTYSDNNSEHVSMSHLLIPHATLSAQIQAAESRLRTAPKQSPQATSPRQATTRPPNSAPVRVPWRDWGPRGCLWLRVPLDILMSTPDAMPAIVIPSGSRLPLLVYHSPDAAGSVYVFDVNPLAARHARQLLAARQRSHSEAETTGALVEDIEAVLPGVVDPECSGIPYVAYRFELPEWRDGRQIRSVEMCMTGFAIEFSDVGREETVQTWTV